MKDQFARYQISCNWECHIARGSSGGTDYIMNVGTVIPASFDGMLTNRPPVQYPGSGNVAILTRNDGLAFYHLHLSRFVLPGPVREGATIGYSGGAVGAVGSGQSTGPHLHINAYIGEQIRDVHDFYTPTPTAPAGTGGTPIIPTVRRPHSMIIYNTGTGFYLTENGHSVEINDATINGQQITRALSVDVLQRIVYGNPEGKLTVNVEEAAIFQYWVKALN